jgi:3-hydroxyisobutyrate dehydrogenase-like beta-hydroxyacid dehydrogenase
MGPPGAGTSTKLILTLPMAVFFAGMAEALSIGTQLGLEMSRVLDVFLDTHGAPPVLRDRVPLLLGAQERPAGFVVAGVRKDLEAMIATAQDAGVPAAAGSAALALFAAAAGDGYADRDLVFVIEYLVELSRRISPEPLLRLPSPG